MASRAIVGIYGLERTRSLSPGVRDTSQHYNSAIYNMIQFEEKLIDRRKYVFVVNF